MDKNRFLIHLSESKRTDFGKVDFATQPEAQRVFSAICELESQVNNGGFDQYFCNADSDTIAFAPAALKAIGAENCAHMVEAALKILSPLPSTRMKRSAALDALGKQEKETLEALTSKFLEYPDDLTKLLFAYVATNPQAFGPIPNWGAAEH